ncbi:MAG TPA: hypothetical protein VH475_07100, partial [Tepidisphaeraceae bacterium]
GARFLVAGNFLGGLEDVTLATDAVCNSTRTGFDLRGTVTLDHAVIDLTGGAAAYQANELGFAGTNVALVGIGEVRLGAYNKIGTSLVNSALTIGPGIFVHGGGTIGDQVLNRGTIDADVAGAELWCTGVSNQGTIHVLNGASMRLTGSWTNAGSITVGDGSSLSLEGTWRNTGTITLADTATLTLHGTFTASDLGAVTRGANTTVNLDATLENTGQVFDAGAYARNFVIKGGTIHGGAVTASAGGVLRVAAPATPRLAGTLDGVTLKTGLAFASSQIAVLVQHGLTLEDASIDLSGGGAAGTLAGNALEFIDDLPQTIGGRGTILLGSTGDNRIVPTRPLTLGPGITLRGAGMLGQTGVPSADFQVINNGTILADVPGGTLTVYNMTNAGSVHIAAGATVAIENHLQNQGELRIDPGAVLDNGYFGTFSQGEGGRLIVNGLFDAYPSADLAGGVVSGSGTITAGLRFPYPVTVGGTISPGATADGLGDVATLSVDGSVALTDGANLLIEFHGDGTSDRLALTGDAVTGKLALGVGASLQLVAADDVAPGTSFVIATFGGSLTGAFDQVTPGYAVSYDTPHEIVVTAVPEPRGIGSLFATAGIAGLLRRRRFANRGAGVRSGRHTLELPLAGAHT